METTRTDLIDHGGSIEFIDHICKIRVNETYKHQQEVFQILETMRKLFRFIQYCRQYHKLNIKSVFLRHYYGLLPSRESNINKALQNLINIPLT